LFSLLFLGAVVTVVAIFVLRTSPTAVESAPYVEPAGTTIAAPAGDVAPPTLVPTVAPGQATAHHDHTQAIAMLPTVAVPLQEPTEIAAPTPTPRAVVLPTVVPLTLPSPAATRPPSQPVSSQPIDAFVATTDAPEPMVASAPQPVVVATEPVARTIQPAVAPTAVSPDRDNPQRAREMQTSRVSHRSTRTRQPADAPPVAGPMTQEPAWQAAPVPAIASGPIDAIPNTSISVPDANAIRDDVAARINAPRP